MLIDNVTLKVAAGDGGKGVATFRRDATTSQGGPDGGNGGNGGNVYFQGSANIYDLRRFRYSKTLLGQNGGDGTRHNGFGKNAGHITVLVPLGTRITNLDTGGSIEIVSEDKPVLIARGGTGGFGNYKFKSPTNRSPRNHEPGGHGQKVNLLLELRLIAEIGLIGLPNAGKSSLLAVLTNAKPVIGDYPFTTLEPNIGMFGKYPVADIPGLIEGASAGIGLGIKFLRHIEKTKILIHCIDITHGDIRGAYDTVRSEFRQYNPLLLDKPEIIFLNKTDLIDAKLAKKAVENFDNLQKIVLTGSVRDEKSIQALKRKIAGLLNPA